MRINLLCSLLSMHAFTSVDPHSERPMLMCLKCGKKVPSHQSSTDLRYPGGPGSSGGGGFAGFGG
jgi:hypothetical protein